MGGGFTTWLSGLARKLVAVDVEIIDDLCLERKCRNSLCWNIKLDAEMTVGDE